MRAGPMRQRVTLQTLVETKDSYGQKLQTWLTTATYWAEVRNLSGREAVNARQIKAEATHMIRMRYVGAIFPSPGLLPSMRIQFNGLNHNILWINNVDNRNREYQILTQEVVQPVPS